MSDYPQEGGAQRGRPRVVAISQLTGGVCVCVHLHPHVCARAYVKAYILGVCLYAERVPEHNLLNGFLKER